MRILKTLFTPVFHIFIEIFIALPLFYLIGGLLMGTPMVYFYIGSIFFAAFMGVLTRKLISVPILQVVLGLGICLAFTLFLEYRYIDGPSVPLIPVATVILVFYRGKLHAQTTWDSIMPAPFLAILLGATFIALAITGFTGDLAPFMTGVTILGPIAVVAALFGMNALNIKEISENAKSRTEGSTFVFSHKIGSLSKIMIIALIIIGLLMSSGPALLSAAKWVGGMIWKVLVFIAKLLFDFDPVVEGQPPSDMEEEVGGWFEIPEADHRWDHVIETVMTIVFVIIIIALAVIVSINFYRLLKSLLNTLRKFLDQDGLSASGADGFIDSRESTVDPSQLPKMYLDSARERLAGLFRRGPTWEDQKTVPDKVKFLFRRAVIKAESSGYRHNAAFTVAEVFREAEPHCPVVMPTAERIKDAYNLVKYSTSLPSEDEVDAIYKKTGYK